MRYFSLYFFLVTTSLNILAQSAKIDSLQKLTESLRGTERIDGINSLAFEIGSYDYSKSNAIAKEALDLSKELKYDKGVAEAMINMAVSQLNVGRDSISIPLLKRSLVLCEKANLNHLKGFGLAYLGLNYQNINKLDSSEQYYLEAYTLLKDSIQPYYLSFLYLNLANLNGLKNKPIIQLEYLLKCWRIRENLTDKKYLVYVGERIAALYNERGDYLLALSYLDRVQKSIGKDTIDNEEISFIYKQRGLVYVNQGKSAEALDLFYKSKMFFERNNSVLDLTNSYLDVGIALADISNYELSLKNYYTGLSLAEKNGFEYERTQFLFRIGWVYWQIDQIQQSLDFATKALVFSRNNHYQVLEGYVLNLLGLLSDRQDNYDEAYNFFTKALAIREEKGDLSRVASTLENIGDLFERKGEFLKSEQFTLQSLSIAEKINNPESMAYAYQSLGQLYTKMGRFKLALNHLIKAENILQKIKSPKILLDVYENRRDLAIALSNFKEATTFALLHENLKNSIYSQNLSDRILALQYDFQIDQKAKEIKILNQQQDLLHAQYRLQRAVLIVTIIILIIVSFIGYLIYNNFRKVKKFNREISEQKEEIQAQTEELTESNQVISHQNEKLKTIHDEVIAQNEVLIQSQEEISSQRDLVSEQNQKLEEARMIIEQQNEEIKLRNETLEEEVESRTKELVEYNQQLEQFAFISSHNLRAPVARILGLGQLMDLAGKTPDDETLIHKSLILTTRELDRVVRDLNTILEIKKNNTSVVTTIDLEEELNLILLNLEKEIAETKAQIQIDFSGVKTIQSIRPYIDSILINLISNAIKYRHPQRSPIIQLKTEKVGDFILLTVKDNGLGIDLSLHKEKIFTLYSRFHTHVDGKGLGLYLVKTQIVAMGGRIEVESEVNNGLTFYIYLKI